jgi:carboxyl-terminal processing protease
MDRAVTSKSIRVFAWSLVSAAALMGILIALPAGQAHTASHQAGSSGLQSKLDLLGDVIEHVHAQYVDRPDDAKMVEGAINGMLATLDPHSSYMNAKQYAEMQEDMSGEFGGLGIEIKLMSDALKIVAPIDDTPATRAGLRANDLITKIDGKPVDMSNIDGSVAQMRGPLGAPVTLTISRNGVEQPFDVTLKRDVIHLSPVKARVEDNVAYLAISSFTEQTPAAVEKAIAGLKDQIGSSLKGYVLDLRNDPGGLLDASITVTGQFLKAGKIVSVKGRNGLELEHAEAVAGDITNGKPIVVLINGATASAAEIVTGALQDDKRATVVGTRSFGKGTVQNIIPLGKGNGALRLTTARYYTPSGRSIQAKGIDPDIVVEENVPAQIRAKLSAVTVPGEGSLSNHLKNPEGDENAAASLAYIPEKAEDDTQLQYALGLIRGTAVVAAGPSSKLPRDGQAGAPVAN